MRQKKVDKAIENFYEHFIKNPYLHRCEHSLHVSLYNELIKQFPEKFIWNNGKKYKTNYIHKEFPGRKKNDNLPNNSQKKLVDRTQIDIVVLAENQQTDSINGFLDGNFDIDYTFELSLEYGIEHLCWDIFKFITGSNKSINHKNYIIHLYNNNHSKKHLNKDNVDIMLNNTINTNLNKKFELCYYLIKLCIKYTKNKDNNDYEKILAIIMHFVKNKNKKYGDEYLLDSKEDMQEILQQMKFIFIDAYPKTKINLLMNI